MVDEVLAVDPYFLGAPELPARPAPARQRATRSRRRRSTPGAARSPSRQPRPPRLCQRVRRGAGRPCDSRLVGYDADAEAGHGRRGPHGARRRRRTTLTDEDAHRAGARPGARIPTSAIPLFLGMNSKLMQTMNHVPFTFQKRISGAEDAQNQRHRGTLSSRPAADRAPRREPDVIVPWAIRRTRRRWPNTTRRSTRSGRPRTRCSMRRVARSGVSICCPTPPRPLLRERHAARLLLEVGQAALLRRPARDLRHRGRGSRPGARGASRRSAAMSTGRRASCAPAPATPDLPRGRALLRHSGLARLPFEDLVERRVM